jgi:hypothetical protein
MKNILTILAAGVCILATGCAHVSPTISAERKFDFKKDSFAFSNETVWLYKDGKPITEREQGTEALEQKGEHFTRRCFVMSRAALQFWKFARFDPKGKPLAAGLLAERIREVTERDVWDDPLPRDKRVVFPGYRNLHEMSGPEAKIMQENIGLGWPTYFRLGNWSIITPPSRAHQERTHNELQTWLKKNQPMVLWLINFPSVDINHAVLVFDVRREGKFFVYNVCDPNYIDRPRELHYDPSTRTFSYGKNFYFSGGEVDVRPVYLSELQ